ncbi:hypothetical protein QTA58_02765 [Neorhizobium sp. CSC1952]|uniref:hypothetical protein n=1 Tax=Neorhizobium TaxID=1525371 RepID=UPI0025A6658C|nr:hypothetical protein [Rhizobium sp. CSC1952]WJR67706.1 hypothetical protein QTA58_02765 [Rhizobium sp. CSC1952]
MEDEIQPLSDAKKEQIKLRATFLNNIGIGVMLIGVFTPIVRVIYGDMNAQVDILWLAGSPLGCFLLGIALHLMAGWMLRGLSK